MIAAFAYLPGLIGVLLIIALICVILGWSGKVTWHVPVFLLIIVEMLRYWPA